MSESYLPRPPLARMRDENARLLSKTSQLQAEVMRLRLQRDSLLHFAVGYRWRNEQETKGVTRDSIMAEMRETLGIEPD